MRANLEVPGLAEIRMAERLNRALAFAGLTHTLCGVQVRPLTPGKRLGLQLLRNAFASAAEPLRGDVHTFLWFLSPHWQPGGSRGRVLRDFRQFLLRRRVRRLDLPAAVREIRIYIAEQLQDLPEETTGGGGVDHSNWIHWVAQDASFWMNVHGGFTLEAFLNTPYLVLQQLHRAWKVNHPDVTITSSGQVVVDEPQFINESDRVFGQFMAARREEIAAVMRSQVHRLP